MTNLSLKTKIEFDHKEDTIWGSFDYNNKVYNPIQLKDGTILIYTNEDITIFSKNLKHKKLISFSNEYVVNDNSIVISKIKQIKNGKIFCCVKNLYIFEIKDNNIINTKKIIFPDDEYIYDIIELKNGKLLGISNNSIFEIKNEGEKYTISKLFQIPNNWLIIAFSKKERFFSSFKQYIDMYELPNNRLIIHSHSSEFSHNGGCGTAPPSEISVNKIFILKLENFEIYEQFNEIISELNIIILNKYFCLCYSYFNYYRKIIDIYDINDYKLIKRIDDGFDKDYIIKYNKNMFLALSQNEKINDIILYNISKINNIEFKKINGDFIKFKTKIYNCCYPVRNLKNKTFCILKNGDILIICHGFIYIVNFPESFNKLPFNSLKEIENKKKINYINFD